MAVYSQYNPVTGQFEYFQGAPAAPQSSGDPASWDYRYWGQADPRAYPDYWADPNGTLLADAVRMGNAWTAPQTRQLPMYLPPYDMSARYYGQPQFTGAAGEGGGGGAWGGVGPSFADRAAAAGMNVMRSAAAPYIANAQAAANAAQWFSDTGRRAAEAQDAAEDWIAGIR